MKTYTRTRLEAGTLLGTRAAVAAMSHRHESLIRRYCEPLACDVNTRALLFDLDDACEVLGVLIRRCA